MKKIFTLLLMLLPFVARATDDFTAVNDDGITLGYKLVSRTECEVSSADKIQTGTIRIPSKVTFTNKELDVIGIGYNAFSSHRDLTSIIIPNSVTYIGSSAFWGCRSLSSIEIPNSVTSIGGYAFCYCESLTSIVIPNTVTSIGEYAFYDCTSLTSIEISNSVTSISDHVFQGCKNLTSVTIPNSVTSIGYAAFGSCSSLTSIEIPNSVTSIGDLAFHGCKSLTSIVIPNRVTSIGSSAFGLCSALAEIIVLAENPPACESFSPFTYTGNFIIINLLVPQGTKGKYESAKYWKDFWTIEEHEELPSGCFKADGIYYKITSAEDKTVEVTYKGDREYSFSNEYTGDVSIPATVNYNGTEFSVTGIGIDAFYCCTGVTSVTIPNSVTSIGNGAFYDCEGLTSVNLPEGITTIGDNTFEYCYCLTSVIIPNNVTSIGRRAFISCKALTSISIPNSVTSIEEYAFTNCMSLTSIVLPTNLESLNPGLFMFCTALKDVTVHWETPYNISELKLFKDCDLSDATLHVPAGSADAYKAAEGWKEFGNIVAITNGDDAIEEITLDQQSDLIYNLDGVKVDNNYRGISVRNGKKVLVK